MPFKIWTKSSTYVNPTNPFEEALEKDNPFYDEVEEKKENETSTVTTTDSNEI